MIPGMYGIAAPYWKETVVTEFVGSGGNPSQEVQLRAGMESIAFLVSDILRTIQSLPDFRLDRMMAAGGAARPSLLQFLADLLGTPVHHASLSDATALGCAFLTGLSIGFWRNIAEVQSLIREEAVFSPVMTEQKRQSLLDGWHQALREKGVLS